jgi:hypothetical protein
LKKTIFLILLLIIFRSFVLSLNENFKMVKIIEDQSDYIFENISDATLTSCNDIIILDGKGCTVSKYDWDGNLIMRIGQRGRGPGDFFWPTKVNIFNEKIYILDKLNYRFVEANLELKNLKHFKLEANRLLNSFDVIDNNKFIISFTSFNGPDNDKINIVDKNENVIKSFFNHTVVDISSIKKDSYKLRKLTLFSDILFSMNNKSEKLLISFASPGNPINLYLYNVNGELIRKFSYQVDKKYQFLHQRYTAKKSSLSMLKGQHILSVQSIFNYNNHWYVFFSTKSYKSGNFKLTPRNLNEYSEKILYYLKLDENGNLIGKFAVNPYFKCFYISKDGYVLGKHPHSESEELVIYKMIN